MFSQQTVGMRLVAVILAVAIPLAMAMAFLWWTALQDGRARQFRLLEVQVAQVERDLRKLWGDAAWFMPKMAGRPLFRSLRPDACADEIVAGRDVNPAFLGITLWSRGGELVCSTLPIRTGQPAPAPYRKAFDEGMAADGLYLSGVFTGPISGLHISTFTFPVKGDAGAKAGLLSIPVRAEFLESLLLDLDRLPGSAAGVTDREFRLVARVPAMPEVVGKSVAALSGLAGGFESRAGAFEATGVDGVRRVVAHKAVPDSGWHVYVGVEDEVLFSGFRRKLIQGLSAFAAVITFSLGIAYLLSRGISRPLRQLVSVADAVAKGDRSVRAAAPGGNEIALLADHVNQMLDALERSESGLRESEDRYRTLVESSPDAILIHQDYRIVFVNPAMVRLVRAPGAEALLGKPSVSLLAPEHAESSRERSTMLYAGEPQPRVERVYIRLDGTQMDVEIAAAPLTFNSKPAVQVTVRDITARKQAERLLRASMARARELSARLLVAEEAERKRIAHDLHDQLGQELTALKIRLETIAQATVSPETRAELLEVAAAAGEALQRVRQMSVDLRPPQLDSLGLAVALRAHAQRLSSLGNLQVHFDSRGFQGKVPAEIEIMCFRVAQEALTNVMRHSGAANAWIDLAVVEGALRLSVRDDGAGFEVAKALDRTGTDGGFGLLGMQERVALAGGTLDIRSEPAQGCTVTATFPFSGSGA